MKTFVKVVLVVALLAGAAAGGYWWFQQREVSQFVEVPYGEGDPVTVIIPSGTGPKGLAKLLTDGGAVSDADLFYQYIRREKAGPRLKAGEYEFKRPLTPAQVLAMIVAGQVKVYQFTVPEGLRVEEVLPILARSEL